MTHYGCEYPSAIKTMSLRRDGRFVALVIALAPDAAHHLGLRLFIKLYFKPDFVIEKEFTDASA